ncbi:MAG: hypothetical protein FRX48_03348 [Lasallia pustulata]|uniref:Major facilitator superfamily domain, general substrate transporter n=1 Tax=Lasallia pustulata TaxID=136370 RepID=A0A5M8PS30_9LECA|nr:MAG: hypothetical protein FRX48_03348 [Lasallia pustulata]
MEKSLWNYHHNRETGSDGLTLTVSQDEKRLEGIELAKMRKLRFPDPLRALLTIVEKDVFLTALMVTAFQCMMIALPSIFKSIYGFNDLQIGLCYMFRDRQHYMRQISRLQLQTGGPPDPSLSRPPARQRSPALPDREGTSGGDLVSPDPRMLHRHSLGLVTAGSHISRAPLIVLFFSGFFLSGALGMLSTLLVDLYPQNPATATAALNLTRCLMSAAGTAVIQYIIDAMGIRWCYTFLGLLTIAFSPCLWVVMRWGPAWREERFVREVKKKEAKTARGDAGKWEKA